MTTVVGFDELTAMRLAAMVRDEVHRQSIERAVIDTYAREMDTAVVKEEVGPRSGATPGTGRAESIQRDAQASQFNNYSYDVLNIFAATIAVNTYVIVGRLWDGNWYIISADCEG